MPNKTFLAYKILCKLDTAFKNIPVVPEPLIIWSRAEVMIQIVMVLPILFLSLAEVLASKIEPFIVGGSQVSLKKWPFITFIEATAANREVIACGGSLISSQTVLTAAHCLDDVTKKKTKTRCSFKVYMGHSDYSKATVVRTLVDYETPAQYSPDDADVKYDIGVMFLRSPVALKANVQKAILLSGFSYKRHKLLKVAGWGNILANGFKLSQKLKELNVNSVPYRSCIAKYKVICSEKTDINYAFNGDSGGPLVTANNFYQVGLVSYRDVFSGATVYTSIPEYWNWINTTQYKLYLKFCQ